MAFARYECSRDGSDQEQRDATRAIIETWSNLTWDEREAMTWRLNWYYYGNHVGKAGLPSVNGKLVTPTVNTTIGFT